MCALLLPGRLFAQDADELIGFLGDPRFKIRLQAAIQIGKQRITIAAPALRKTLQDENDAVRAAAALALGQLGDQDARRDLVSLLAHSKPLVVQAAARALGLLDQADGQARFLVQIDPPSLAAGVREAYGRKLTRALEAVLAKQHLVVPVAGEPEILSGVALVNHLKQRRLGGYVLRPKLAALSAKTIGGETRFNCKVSIMTIAMGTNRLEFSGSGEAETTIAGRADEDQIKDVSSQLIVAAAEAAIDEVISFMERRSRP